MKYTKYAGYGVLLGASVMMVSSMAVKAEENEQIPIPVEEQTVLEETLIMEEESLTETTSDEPVIEETETINEPVLTAEQTVVNNGIPVVYLHIDESKGTIEAMNSDPKHSTYCYGTMDFTLPSSDFKYVDLDTELQEYTDLDMQIKGRGNTTWTKDKKPYKIKLDKKTDLLGLGPDEKNKHWVLIANAMDPTLIRDRLTGYIGENVGLEYTPIGFPVDVVMNDKYLGSYLLMEHVRLGKGRIDIDELSEEDTDPLTITGGYIIQGGAQTDKNSPSYFVTKSTETWNNHTPSFNPDDGGYENEAQKDYIRNYIQMIEDMLRSDTQSDADGNYYSKYMDLTSAAKYWLVQTVSNNIDGLSTGSMYFYKKRDTEDEIGKLYWGPLWDFDIAWGNDQVEDLTSAEGFSNTLNHLWILPMLHDTDEGSFYQHIQNEWPAIKNLMLDIIQDGGMLDKYYNETKKSKVEDVKTNPSKDSQNDYETIISNTKKWIEHRVNWIDEHLSDLEQISRKVKVVEEEQPDKIFYVNNNMPLGQLGSYEKEGYIFLGCTDQNGTMLGQNFRVTSDMIITPVFISIEDATKYEKIIFQQDVVNILFQKGHSITPPYVGLPVDVQYTKVKWESSDESIASVKESGQVVPQKPGTVTITAVLDNGSRWSYIINFLEKDVMPQDVSFTENMILKVGESKRIDIIVTPESGCLEAIYYDVKPNDIINVNSTVGLVTGRKPGTIEIKLIALYEDPITEKETRWEKICTITVIEDQKDEIPSQENHEVVDIITPASQNPVHGVPTGVDTNTRLWFGSMILTGFGIVFSSLRRLFKTKKL